MYLSCLNPSGFHQRCLQTSNLPNFSYLFQSCYTLSCLKSRDVLFFPSNKCSFPVFNAIDYPIDYPLVPNTIESILKHWMIDFILMCGFLEIQFLGERERVVLSVLYLLVYNVIWFWALKNWIVRVTKYQWSFLV